jgi:GT2 family glycosyltransferase
MDRTMWLARVGAAVNPAPEVSIVIPVLRRLDLLQRCLGSISQLAVPPTFETIVVANGTPPEAVAELWRRDDIVLVASSINLGFAGGCNWGARFARGRFLVLLNDDTEVDAGWLAALTAAAVGSDDIGAVGSRIAGFDGRLQEAGSVLWRDGGTSPVGAGLPEETSLYRSVRPVDYCSGCGLLVPLSDWRALGGLDEAYYPAYHEDVDLCLALRESGLRVLYAPEARLRHHRGASADAIPLRTFAAVRNGERFRAKWAAALAEYDPAPRRGQEAEAIEVAVRRAMERRVAPRRPRGVPAEPGPPTDVEALEALARALQSDSRLNDAFIAQLQEEARRRRQPRATLELLRPLARRVRRIVRLALRRAGQPAGSPPT